jgi:hypothetical protein
MRTDTITRKQETMKAIRLHTSSVPTEMVYEEAPQPHPNDLQLCEEDGTWQS